MQHLYDPLDHDNREIRLLELAPGSNIADTIRCRLKRVPLTTKPTFFALSYVWGDSNFREYIEVNGVQFPATRNLCAVLRRMRDISPATLWIDALCINQNDNDEKSKQICMMREIFQSASLVVIWLGERDFDSDKAMETIFATAHVSKDSNSSEELKQEMVVHGLELDGVLLALGLFFKREWWTRIWVMQEAAVAQRALFVCGDKSLDWKCLVYAYLYWTKLLQHAVRRDQLSPTLQHLKNIIDGTSARVIMWQYARMQVLEAPLLSQHEAVYRLQDMLEESWNFDSTDPRDKVYAWLGVLSDREIHVIEPNYDASPAQVYIKLVMSILEHEKSAKLIAFTGSAVREARPLIEGLPTWAPDLRRDARGTGRRTPYWLRPKSYKASADEPANATISTDWKLLSTDCLRLGQIKSTQLTVNQSKVDDVERLLCRWLYFALSQSTPLNSGVGMLHDALFRTLTYYWDDQYLGLSTEGHQAQQLDMQHMMLGFMATVGYLDRMQDYLQAKHVLAAQDTKAYLLRTLKVPDPATGGTKSIAVLGSASDTLPPMIRPVSLSPRIARADGLNGSLKDPLSSEPDESDYDNLLRFFQLFGLDPTSSPEQDGYISLLQTFLSENGCSWTSGMKDWPGESGNLDTMLSTIKNRMQRFIARFASVSSGKTFFHTDTGYYGLGLEPTRTGDFVCIIRGCSLPLVVRQQEDNDHFEVVGQCYVWGAMYGEAITQMAERHQNWESLTFI